MSGEPDPIDALENAGKLAEARDLAIARGRLARASELALAVDGVARAEALAREALQASDEPPAQIALARVLLRKRDASALDEAEALLARALASADAEPRAHALLLQALAYGRRGDARDALLVLDEAYRVADGLPALRARILLAWSLQLRNFGLFEDAERLAERSLELRLELGDLYGAAMCHGTLAFIAQRQGRHEVERDALVANLRLCEQLGSVADIPGIKVRLAGALHGLGRYAGAWTEAEQAIALAGATPNRTHAFAWREQARICLVRGALADGLALCERAIALFEQLRDDYGSALARITEAELAQASGDTPRALRALGVARPLLIAVGALPEIAETVLVELACGADPAEALVQRLMPALVLGGLGHGTLFRRVRDALAKTAPRIAITRAAEQAAMLRGLAAIAAQAGALDGTVVAARVPGLADARTFALAAVDVGGIVVLGASGDAVSAFVGARHAEAAASCVAALPFPTATATGSIELEHVWPAGVRVRGAAVDAALGGLA